MKQNEEVSPVRFTPIGYVATEARTAVKAAPVRPNPIGLSELEVLEVEGNIIHVKGLDMIDGTPILDIKPVI